MRDKIVVHLGSTLPTTGVIAFIVAVCIGTTYPIAATCLVIFAVVGLFIGCFFESASTDAMWDARRKRWLKGGYDPAYPNDDKERRRIIDAEKGVE